MVTNGPSRQKWSKSPKMVKIVQNGTSLSAQRARRTKTRGPKGLQLEVEARRACRAPRLLVSIYFKTQNNLSWSCKLGCMLYKFFSSGWAADTAAASIELPTFPFSPTGAAQGYIKEAQNPLLKNFFKNKLSLGVA